MSDAASSGRILLATLLSLIALTARSEVLVHEERVDYVLASHVQADLRAEWMQAMQAREPGAASRSHGLTRSDIEVRFQLQPLTTGRCAIEDVRITLNLRFEVPRWQPIEPPSDALRARADAVWQRVDEHGRQHRDNAELAAQQIDQALALLGEHDDCKSLNRQVDRIVNRRLARLWTQQRRYDEESDLQAASRMEAVAAARKQDSDNKLRKRVTDRRGRRTSPSSLTAVGM